MTYRMVMIGGVARLSRPSHVLYPLPSVRADRKVSRYAHVRDVEPTMIKRTELATLPMTRYVLTSAH